MRDQSPIAEVLRSPLDDQPPRRGLPPGWTIGAAAAMVIGITFAVVSSGDGDVVATTPSEAGTSTVAASTTTTTPTVVISTETDLEAAAFQESVALPPDRLMVFGGFTAPGGSRIGVTDTWIYDLRELTWFRLEHKISPSPRFGQAMAYHPPTGKVVVFGGGAPGFGFCTVPRFCPGEQNDEVWLFDSETTEWEQAAIASGPEARFGARFAYDPASELLVLFGGVSVEPSTRQAVYHEDTWVLDVSTMTWDEREPDGAPSGRVAASMTTVDDRILMFGGDGLGDDDDVLWSYDPVEDAWTVVTEGGAGPSPRWLSLLTTDPLTGDILLIGGQGVIVRQVSENAVATEIAALDEVWLWSQEDGWVQREPFPDQVVVAHGLVDQVRDRLLVYFHGAFYEYAGAVDEWSIVVE